MTKLQYELMKNTYDDRRYSIGERPGEYKKHDYVTGGEEVEPYWKRQNLKCQSCCLI